MRAALVTLLVLAAPGLAPATAAAAPPRADLMVVGKSRVLRDAGPVTLRAATVRAGGRRCRVAGRTPLGALARTRLRLRLRDYGRCSRRARDAGALYVLAVGRDRETRRAGWVYKLGRRAGTAGAGDPAARVRRGGRVLWFFCRLRRGGCQRTLEAVPDRRAAAPGETLAVTVTGYDDQGRGKRVPGATVRLGSASATTGPDGVAVLTVPPGSGKLAAVATHPQLVRSFPAPVRVG